MPTREEVELQLISVLIEIQKMSGREVPDMTADLHPMCDLDGFESLNAAEATAMLERELNLKVTKIPFFAAKGEEALTIRQIADKLLATCKL